MNRIHRHKYHYRPTPAGQLAAAPRFGVSAVRVGVSLPASADLRDLLLPVRDQEAEGCCSGFAAAAQREQARARFLASLAQVVPLSPAYLYAKTRMAEGTFPQDAGATIGDEMSTLTNLGVCPESFLPYNAQASEAPTPACDVAAQPLRVTGAVVVDHADPIFLKQVLALGQAINFGMPVYESFEDTGSDGMVTVPDTTKEAMLGGHAMLCVGFLDSIQRFIIRNSWNKTWGDGGYCYMPYLMVYGWMEAWTIPNQA